MSVSHSRKNILRRVELHTVPTGGREERNSEVKTQLARPLETNAKFSKDISFLTSSDSHSRGQNFGVCKKRRTMDGCH